MQLKDFPDEDENIICTVDRVVSTSVFVKLDEYSGKEGVIVFSEVAPGRIRNIRDYIRHGQKIVCKVLRIDKDKGHIDLSLRRVSTKEKKEVLENYQKEKEIFAVLNIIVKDKKRIDEMVKKLRQKSNFVEFCGNVAVNAPGCMLLLEESGFEKDEANKFVEIIKEKVQEKKATVKTKFTITSDAANGIEKIKKILVELEDKAKINYMGSSNYLLTIEDNNYKEANRKLREALDLLVAKAKESECKVEVAKTK